MAKKLDLCSIQIQKRTGEIFIEFDKISSDGDSLGRHKTSVEVCGDCKKQIHEVNTHLAMESFEPLLDSDAEFLCDVASIAWQDKYLSDTAKSYIEKRKLQHEEDAKALAETLAADSVAVEQPQPQEESPQ